ncbi:hypothetical protein [Tepidibacter hydrothermalis]|uniref:DUF1540 domain-containing protein n=1 Tax=Tepidibacter hydrothermalis TaxID=3036126 RepID=A0ABY8E8S2_9FIRM|nr:hypothetical protein [Tepidibacter hydrothermalis]WFD09305.1 hypothetical protein P4S50_13025 [Tepidibacter hydrothermalis]
MENLNMSELKAVASRCSQYSPMGGNQFTSSAGQNEESCSKCEHYENSKCTLDLIDQIKSNMQ